MSDRILPPRRLIAIVTAVLSAVMTCGRISAQRITIPSQDDAAIVVPTGRANVDAAWTHYLALWRAIHDATATDRQRRLVRQMDRGPLPMRVIPSTKPVAGRPRLPRATAKRWATSLLQIDTTADEQDVRVVAADLHEVYWAWTQVCFPLWRYAPAVTRAIAQGISDEQIGTRQLGRLPPMNIVLLRDVREYRRVLSSVPNIAESTGYYDPKTQTSYFYVGQNRDPSTGLGFGQDAGVVASRTHEFIHQLMAEATLRPRRSRDQPVGEEQDFWLVEGLAGYFESLTPIPASGGESTTPRRRLLGGWDASRLQYARLRVATGDPPQPLSRLRLLGRRDAQSLDDLPGWYGDSIAWTHALMAEPTARSWLISRLAELYGIDSWIADPPPPVSVDLASFLMVDDVRLIASPTQRRLRELCLAGCDISDAGLASVATGDDLVWLDLAQCNVGDAGVRPLVRSATQLDEVDLTGTRITDETVMAMPGTHLRVFYATNTPLTDRCIGAIARWPALQSIDVQATMISDAALQTLRERQPQLTINPRRVVRKPAGR